MSVVVFVLYTLATPSGGLTEVGRYPSEAQCVRAAEYAYKGQVYRDYGYQLAFTCVPVLINKEKTQ
jgi:hypothetical protein